MGKLDDIIAQINADITTKEEADSITPEDVGGAMTAMAEAIEPYLGEYNTALSGTAVPISAIGAEGDFYWQTGNDINVYQKGAVDWTYLFTIPLGFSFPDGVLTGLGTSILLDVITVAPGAWYINNIFYQKPTQTQFTLTPDLTYDRIDVIYADTNNNILIIEGTPSETPIKPDIPPNTIEVTFVLVPVSGSPEVPDSYATKEYVDGKTAVKADIDASNINKTDWETALGVSETDTVSSIVKRNSQGNIIGKYLAMTSTVIDQQTNIGSLVGKYDNGDNTLREFSAATIKTFLGLSSELSAYQALSQKNQPNGYAGLDANGLIISSLLPSYVDDVLEFPDFASLPASGESGKIYITTDNNKSYRWSGSIYSEIVASPGSTDAVPEGSLNLYYTDARVKAYADTRYALISSLGSAAYLNADVNESANSVVKRDAVGSVKAYYLYNSNNDINEALLPTSISGEYGDGYIRKFNASTVRQFLGMPTDGETLQSVTDRGLTTTKRLATSAGLSLDGTDANNWIIKKNGTVVEFWLAGVLSMKLDSTGLKLKTGLQFYPDNF